MISLMPSQPPPSASAPGIRTVRGDLRASELGFTLCHEHLFTKPAHRLRDGVDLLLDDEAKAEIAGAIKDLKS